MRYYVKNQPYRFKSFQNEIKEAKMKNYLNFKKSAIATVLLLTLSNSVYSADLLGSNSPLAFSGKTFPLGKVTLESFPLLALQGPLNSLLAFLVLYFPHFI